MGRMKVGGVDSKETNERQPGGTSAHLEERQKRECVVFLVFDRLRLVGIVDPFLQVIGKLIDFLVHTSCDFIH